MWQDTGWARIPPRFAGGRARSRRRMSSPFWPGGSQMNHAEYDRMFGHEDHYWWFVARRELVVEMVRGLGLPQDARILDVGCGTGATAAALEALSRVIGADFAPLALERCRRRGLGGLVQAAAERLPLQSASVDVIVATDILEHLDDDMAALGEFYRLLRPGGHAVISVPAYPFLWGEHDLALMHRRRYVAAQVRHRAELAGFRIERLSYALAFLLPLALLRLIKRQPTPARPPEAQLWPVPAWLNTALVRLQRVETAILKRIALPFGLSVLAVIEKPLIPSPVLHRPNRRHETARATR